MGVVPLISLHFPLQPHLYIRTHLKNPTLWPKYSVSVNNNNNNNNNNSSSSKRGKLRSKSNDDPQPPMYMDEKGVVNDMEGYLNSLSLEYDSVWDTKPSWCQPWTIGLTGVSVVACSWLVLHSIVITGLVSFLICAWWYIFLYSYPKAYTEMIAERRERVKSGTEDTWKKFQKEHRQKHHQRNAMTKQPLSECTNTCK